MRFFFITMIGYHVLGILIPMDQNKVMMEANNEATEEFLSDEHNKVEDENEVEADISTDVPNLQN